MPLQQNFNNKVVLVTGSSSGIGAATAILFSELGAKVVVHGRDRNRLSEVAKECQKVSPNNVEPLEVIADMSKEEDVNRLMDTVIAHFNQLDVVVNNAGIGGGSDHESLQEYDEYMNINLRSVYQICFRALPLLEKSKGVIINNSSVCGIKPFPHSVSYCVAKAGIDMLTRCLAINWGPKGIRVNGVNPGQIDTGIWLAGAGMSQKELDTMWSAVAAKNPIRRKGYSVDIAKAIVFLASNDSGFITGVNLKVDGGFLDSASLILD